MVPDFHDEPAEYLVYREAHDLTVILLTVLVLLVLPHDLLQVRLLLTPQLREKLPVLLLRYLL